MGGLVNIVSYGRPSLMIIAFTSTYRGVNARLAWCLNSVLNVKAVVAAFNQEEALVAVFSVIVKTDGALHSTNLNTCHQILQL